MDEKAKQRAEQYIEELRRKIADMKAEVGEAMNAANIAEEFATRKRVELLRVERESVEAQQAVNLAHELLSAKRDEYDKLLATLADEWRDKTNPPN